MRLSICSVLATTAACLALCTGARAAEVDLVVSYSGQFDLPIPADPDASRGWMADAIIDVPHHWTVQDVDVSVDLTHTNVFDLQLYVESPCGTRVLLNAYDPFSGYFEGADYAGTTFDDEAATAIEEGSAPFDGRFRPLVPNRLSAFDGEDAFGPWRLQVYDAYYGDTGSLNAFTLTLTVPEPATLAFLLAASTLAAVTLSHRPCENQ